MKLKKDIIKVGIVGCGAIGSRIAKSVVRDLKRDCQLTGIYDIVSSKASDLENNLSLKNIKKASLKALIQDCDLMIEAISATNTHTVIRQALQAKKDVLVMSVGKLLPRKDLFALAKKNRCALLIPSGAIAGLDALKAACLSGIRHITLTTRKPLKGLTGNPYFTKKGIDILKIKKETVLFKGSVTKAVKNFPQNINVAAALALASRAIDKITVRIITSPKFKKNSHEIEAVGAFGRIVTKTENVPCPDNPKTSYLAVLSGIQTLKQFCSGVSIGT